MTNLSDRLRHLRIDNGKEKEELAAYLSISVDSYTRYERGSRQPDVDSLVKLAIFYGVSLDYLLGRDDIEMPVFDRSQVISYRDLVDLGLNAKLAHGIITQITSRQAFEDRIRIGDDKIKYVTKESVVSLLAKLTELIK